jgi:hypothetical protein
MKKMKSDTVFPVSTVSYNVKQSRVNAQAESFTIVFDKDEEDSLQDLTVLPTEFFRRCKTHIPSVIILPTESKTEMIRQ